MAILQQHPEATTEVVADLCGLGLVELGLIHSALRAQKEAMTPGGRPWVFHARNAQLRTLVEHAQGECNRKQAEINEGQLRAARLPAHLRGAS